MDDVDGLFCVHGMTADGELFAYLGELFAYVSVVVNGGAVGLTSAHGRRGENSLLIISLSFPEMGGNRA